MTMKTTAASEDGYEIIPVADDGGTGSTTNGGMGESTGSTFRHGMAGEGGDMGMMSMRPVSSIELPAGKTVKLEPGGYHIMLIGLVNPLEEGKSIEVTLTFENAPKQTLTAPVRAG